jgi:A/G-specific adenine glycosylase
MIVNKIDRKIFVIASGGPTCSQYTFSRSAMTINPDFHFSRILLRWNKMKNQRKMPWKGEKDPYKIWLSEIILQQTRVDQGLKYYENFIKAFPTINKLAKATDDRVYKLWEGLGYYSRCKNLIATARHIANDHSGKFPGTYEEIISLKGVGPYTASAIASFAFDQPFAVVDGNVFRVLARIFGINKPIDLQEGKKYFNTLANKLLDKKQPGIYNQAIMDFGATVCKPVPGCRQCPFRNVCEARLNNLTEALPVKSKKQNVKRRWFYYIVPEFENMLGLNRRSGSDIWRNLYQFSLVESTKELDRAGILKLAERKKLLGKNTYRLITVSQNYHQRLSHQIISGKFLRIKLHTQSKKNNGGLWVNPASLKRFAFPQFINQYLRKEGIVK